jgi:predicted deacetylase
MPRRLLASIHDVSPAFESQVDALYDRLCGLLGGPRLAMLVVPDFEDQAPLARSPAYAAKLRGWAKDGVEMFLHGWCHRDDAKKRGFMQKHMTAGAGEFAQLSKPEALHRLSEGRKVVEDAIGAPVAGFIAPAWLYSAEALDALGEAGFALAENHLKVWQPTTGRVVAKSPVITWASRTPGRVRRWSPPRPAQRPGHLAMPASPSIPATRLSRHCSTASMRPTAPSCAPTNPQVMQICSPDGI